MKKFYFTFGQSHTHTVNGETFDKDSVVAIEARDYDAARSIMVDNFGTRWAFQYDDLESVNLHYYSRGVIELTKMQEQCSKRQQTIDGVREMLDFLEANPSIELPYLDRHRIFFLGFVPDEKEKFLDIAKDFGSFEKEFTDNQLRITKTFGSVQLIAEINRAEVCTKRTVIKEVEVEEWDCPPLLSEAEIDAELAEVMA